MPGISSKEFDEHTIGIVKSPLLQRGERVLQKSFIDESQLFPLITPHAGVVRPAHQRRHVSR